MEFSNRPIVRMRRTAHLSNLYIMASSLSKARPSLEVTSTSLSIPVTQEAVLNAKLSSVLVHIHTVKG